MCLAHIMKPQADPNRAIEYIPKHGYITYLK